MSAQIRWSDSRPQCRECGERNIVMHDMLDRDDMWVHWFECRNCGHETPKRHLSPDALKDVDWVPFVKVGGTDGSQGA